MAALSDYLETGLLNHVFRGQTFSKPRVCIALCSGVPKDSDTGSTIPELPSGITGFTASTNYRRLDLGESVNQGDIYWKHDPDNISAGSGVISNSGQLVFSTALQDWGWVSGIAIVDHPTHGSGNLLMHAQLDNPRIIYTGDNVKFDFGTLEISFK